RLNERISLPHLTQYRIILQAQSVKADFRVAAEIWPTHVLDPANDLNTRRVDGREEKRCAIFLTGITSAGHDDQEGRDMSVRRPPFTAIYHPFIPFAASSGLEHRWIAADAGSRFSHRKGREDVAGGKRP